MDMEKNEFKGYKQYHEDDGITFRTESKIYFGQCDGKKNLKLSEILRYCSDLATEDFDQRGISRDRMISNHFAMLVSRSSFRFHRIPKETEHIVIVTREEKPETFQIIRSYEFETADGEKLISAKSTWLFADPETRRIVPTKKFFLREPNDIVAEHDCLNPGKISIPENLEFIGEQTILPNHIDGNGHMTNSRYADLATDFLPEKYADMEIKDFRINYCKEVYKGDVVKIYAAFDDENKKATVVGKHDGVSSFESEIFWK